MTQAISERVCGLAAGIFGLPSEEVTTASTPDTIASWDSFATLNLLVALEDEFAIEIDPDNIEELTDLASIAAFVASRLAP